MKCRVDLLPTYCYFGILLVRHERSLKFSDDFRLFFKPVIALSFGFWDVIDSLAQTLSMNNECKDFSCRPFVPWLF